MGSLILFALLLGTLFCFSFFAKRRFGVLGLALAAGALLSANWSQTLTPFLEDQGIVLVSPPLEIMVQALLILAPPLLLLFSGQTYTKLWQRVVGSALFALLAFTFLSRPLGSAVFLDGTGMQVYTFFRTYSSILIVIGIVVAIIDVLLTPRTKPAKGKGAH
jgi:hypothetical protein